MTGPRPEKIPGLRIILRDEPLHPRYRKRATEREKKPGRRYQLIATSTPAGQIAWLDARHRSHLHVENDVKQAKALGLSRWPSRHWAINVAWTQVVALAANLLACFRHLALPAGDLREAARSCCGSGCCTYPPASPGASGNAGCSCAPAGPGPPT